MVFLSVTVDTSDRVHDDYSRLLFLQVNREVSTRVTKYRRNRINFVFVVLTDMLILRVSGVDFGVSALYTITVFHSLETSSSTLLPSFLLLGVLTKRYMRGLGKCFIGFSYHS
jgi:hypothetical protein